MTPELRHIGGRASPVVVIDGFGGDAEAVVEIASALAPFPSAHRTYYPGLRRVIGERDGAAWDYVMRSMRAAASFIGGGFDTDGFDLIEASFSMVTARPHTLGPAQRAPHFDSTDPDYIAVLHYLGGVAGSGTAFYRQRSTGIERVDEANLKTFVAAAQRESGELDGYTCGSNRFFEQVAAIEAVPDRLIIYQGALLHSGIIPSDMAFSDDPRTGRLTANFFVRATRG
jgi:hypothetical protein